MKKNQQDKPLLKFSSPDPVTSRIFVSKVLPDNSLEPIGIVFPCFSNEDGCVYYYSSDMNCDNIGSYTSDFNEVEKKFEKYAKELSEKSLTEKLRAEAEILIERENSIKRLRKTKTINREFNLLLNNF